MVKIIWNMLFVVFIYVTYIESFKVIFERTTVTYQNEKYVSNLTLYVKRHGRRSDYCINLEVTTKMTFANNVTLHVLFFEFLNNQYKRTKVVEIHFKLCDLINNEPYIGGALANAGVVCPLKPGFQQALNITAPTDKFPNVWPFEKCKAEVSVTQSYTGELIASADVYASFKQKLARG